MSVSLIISNPINNTEMAFYLPISSEKDFEKMWMPIIYSLDLKWMKCFESGIEFEKNNVQCILDDMAKMKKYIIKSNINSESAEQMIERLDNVNDALLEILNNKRDDIKLYIG